MRLILTFLVLMITLPGQTQTNTRIPTSDLVAVIDQTAFNKIINSATLPMILFEHRDPFPGLVSEIADFKDYTDSTDKVYSTRETRDLFKWAIEGVPGQLLSDSEDDIFKEGIRKAWTQFKREVETAIAAYDQNSKVVNDAPVVSFEVLNIDDLRKLKNANVEETFTLLNSKATSTKSGSFLAKAHLAYAKVELTDRPALSVNSPQFSATNIRVTATATGELWLRLPRIVCCRWWGPLCVCFRADWNWTKVAQLTVSPKIGSDISINFSIENLKIIAMGKFNSLFLDYNILREINLAFIANNYLRMKKFELYDVSQFVASIPYINKNFSISEIRLPSQTGSVRVEVDVKQIQ